MADYHYNIQLVVNAAGRVVGQGMVMRFVTEPGGASVPVTDMQGNPISLVTSDQSVTPPFIAPYRAGFLTDATGAIALDCWSREAAQGVDVPTKQYVDDQIAALGGGGTPIVPITQAEYDALAAKDPGTLYVIIGPGGTTGTASFGTFPITLAQG